MYFLTELRGRGIADRLLDLLLTRMRAAGYRRVYLETQARMTSAQRLYARHGFREVDDAMGDTGHKACDTQFLREL